MSKPKLIMLYGFAASGKTTLLKKYLQEHPFALSIEGDQIISMMGMWRQHEKEAREIVFEHTKVMVANHLEKGYDVLLPYLLTQHTDAETFEKIAAESSSDFYEVYISINRDEAIRRLLKRGIWGEEDSPQLTNDDLPEINKLYDEMESAMKNRMTIKTIASDFGDIEGAYSQFIATVS
jgi:predicted kinase